MAINVCDPCADQCLRTTIGGDNMKGMWRRAVFELLCGLSGSVPSAANSVVLAQVVKGFAVVPAAYADVGLLDSTKNLRRLYINNTTDTDIEISVDNGTTTAFTVPANSSSFREFGGFQAAAQDDLQYRYSSATGAPTTGSVYFDGSY